MRHHLLLVALLLIGCAGWMFFQPRAKLSRLLALASVLESSPAAETWDGVWMNGPALLRLRQKGAALTGDYGPGAAFHPVRGVAEGNTATFRTTIGGRVWNFRLSRESSTAARLLGRLDVDSFIARPGPQPIIAPHARAERAKDQRQLEQERAELLQIIDFGVFEKIE